MRHWHARSIAFLATLLCACASPPPKTPTITSAIAHRAAELPRTAYVLAHLDPELPDAYEDGYLATLTQGLEALGTTVRGTKLTGLELDRSAASRSRESFAPDATFTVVFQDRFVSGSTHRGEVLVQLVDARGIELWTSRQTFAFTSFLVPAQTISAVGEKAGNAAIEKLEEDRVFPGPD